MTTNFDIALQLAIKALDSAEQIRRSASRQRTNANKLTVGQSAFQHKQLEADEAYASDVVELAIRVIATCMFNGEKWGASGIITKANDRSLVPSTVSMESYIKKLRLERVSRNEDDWAASCKIQRSNSFDAACDELMGLHTPELSPCDPSSLTPDSNFGTSATDANELDDDSLSVSRLLEEGNNRNINYTPSTPFNRKRLITTSSASAKRSDNASDIAEALSPSASYMSNFAAPTSTTQRLFLPHTIRKILNDDYAQAKATLGRSGSTLIFENLEFAENGRDEEVNSLANASAKITLQPKRKSFSPQVKSPTFSTTSPIGDGWTTKEEIQKTLVMDDLSDILLWICGQLDNLSSRKPNFYGGVFHMQPLVSQLGMLKRRLLACLDYIVTGGFMPSNHPEQMPGRNAPMVEGEDCKRCVSSDLFSCRDTGPFQGTSIRIRMMQCLPFRDVTGRVFWEDYCCDAGIFSLFVTWRQFADAFERVFGEQPQPVMERLREALDGQVPKNSFQAVSHEPPAWDEPKGSHSSPSVSSPSLNKLNFFRLSPSRKKLKSHVPRWIRRKIIPCSTTSQHVINDSCEACADFQEDRVNLNSQETETNSSTFVYIESFAKFCTDHGGLFEGFVAVTDPGTHIECLGSVEDFSKEELLSLGLLEGNDEPLLQSGEVGEASFAFKPCTIRDLLGLKILQLSCGGQHAAVLVEGGDVFTVRVVPVLSGSARAKRSIFLH